jgi:hypothetical protein
LARRIKLATYLVYLIVLSRLTDFRERREVAAMYAAM